LINNCFPPSFPKNEPNIPPTIPPIVPPTKVPMPLSYLFLFGEKLKRMKSHLGDSHPLLS